MTRFDMRSATELIQKTLIGNVNAFQLTLDRLTRQSIPMRVRRLFQLRQVGRHRVYSFAYGKPSLYR